MIDFTISWFYKNVSSLRIMPISKREVFTIVNREVFDFSVFVCVPHNQHSCPIVLVLVNRLNENRANVFWNAWEYLPNYEIRCVYLYWHLININQLPSIFINSYNSRNFSPENYHWSILKQNWVVVPVKIFKVLQFLNLLLNWEAFSFNSF